MNAQVNSDSIHKLSTGSEAVKPAREQYIASVVRKDRDGKWEGRTQWLFPERPASREDDSTETGAWIIELRTYRSSQRGVSHFWSVSQLTMGGMGRRMSLFGDFSVWEPAHNVTSKGSSKAIAEAHTLAVQQIERIAAAAVEFYKAKQK